MEEFLKRADKQYAIAIYRARKLEGHPEIAVEIQKTKSAFDTFKKTYLKTPPYQPWELDYVRDTVNNHIEEVAKMVKTVEDSGKNHETAAVIMQRVAEVKLEAQSNQTKIESNSRVAAQAQGKVEGQSPAEVAGATPQQTVPPPDGKEDPGQIVIEDPNHMWENHRHEFDSSEVVRLQKHAMEVAANSGHGGGSSGGGGASGGSGGAGAGGGSSTGGSGPNSRGDSGSFADNYGDMVQKVAAQSLAAAGADELNNGHFSAAVSNAQNALALDPSNPGAMMVLHSAQGRAEVGGSAADMSAGGGSARGFAGGGSSEGGRATFASAGRGVAELGAASASRLSGEQAQKASMNAVALGDINGAMSLVSRGLEQNPGDSALLNLRASIHARLGDYAKAIADAKAGLEKAPGNSPLLRTLTYAQLRNKDYKDALASANALIEMDPKDAYGYALRAHAFGSMGDRDAMMSDLKRAAQLDPRFEASLAQVQLPSDSDVLFLFPGEVAPGEAAKNGKPAGGHIRNFGVVAGAAAFGGLLLAIGLLQTVLAPLKRQVSSVFTRLTRTGPSVAAMGDATPQPASINGLMPGLIRGQYEITRQIGQGGMGTVYEGTDRALGRRVAIKKMRDELRVNPSERARFVIEAKTVAALHHPNVVDIYAIAEDGQDVFLVFEFVDGKTVHDLVQHAGRLPIAEAARITRASADALGYAHSRGVIHRDMKPSNVMLDGQGRVKVMDFGIARMAKDSATRYSMTNTVVGTPPYMAPEQEQGQVRKESDVYALGICAYEMLTGKLPFIGIGAGMLMNKINMSFIPPSRAIAGLPESLDEVFTKAFQADPDKRYRTPKEFADALELALPAGARIG